MGTKSKKLYTDGGYFEDARLLKWAFVEVSGNVETHREAGEVPFAGNGAANVESAEVEALRRAVDYADSHPGNYEVVPDSRAVLDKVFGNVSNATGNPHVNYLRATAKKINDSPLPVSLTFKYRGRRSDEWAKLVDDLCGR